MLTWYLEEAVMAGSYEDLARSIRDLGYEAVIALHYPEERFPIDSQLDVGYFVFHGSFQLAKEILKGKLWSPGVIGGSNLYELDPFYNYKWVIAKSVLGDRMLSSNVTHMELGWLLESFHDRLKGAGMSAFFVRPMAIDKPFRGQVVGDTNVGATLEEFRLEISTYEVPMDTVVIYAPYRSVDEEWRLLLVGRKYVAGCLAIVDGKYVSEYKEPEGAVVDYANRAARSLMHIGREPFIMDVASSEGGLYVVEVSPFSCSDLYNIPTDAIAASVSEYAVAECLGGESSE